MDPLIRKQFTRVLEAKRSQKVAIIKSTLPPTATLKQNVETMDGLSLDQLSLLLSALPEPDEVKMIEDAAQGNAAPLDLPEQFLYELSRIPSIKSVPLINLALSFPFKIQSPTSILKSNHKQPENGFSVGFSTLDTRAVVQTLFLVWRRSCSASPRSSHQNLSGSS